MSWPMKSQNMMDLVGGWQSLVCLVLLGVPLQCKAASNSEQGVAVGEPRRDHGVSEDRHSRANHNRRRLAEILHAPEGEQMDEQVNERSEEEALTGRVTSRGHIYRRHSRGHHRQTGMHRCRPGHFWLGSVGRGRCTPCSACPEGYGIKHHCTGQRDTVCEMCLPGIGFLEESTPGSKVCVPCRACVNREVKSECTVTSNTICGDCNRGYFLDDLTLQCLPCSDCRPDLPGYGIQVPLCVSQGLPPEMTCLPSPPPRIYPRLQHGPSGVRDSSGNSQIKSLVRDLEAKVDSLKKDFSEKLEDLKEQMENLRRTCNRSR